MALHQDQILSVEDDLAEIVAKKIPLLDNGNPYHDIIEIHDDYTTTSENFTADDDSSIVVGELTISNYPPLLEKETGHQGVVSKFRHMILENFASRASMSPEPEKTARTACLPTFDCKYRKRFNQPKVHFLEYRV